MLGDNQTLYKRYNFDYNNSMNIRKRWTVLNVDESIIEIVRKFAADNGYTTSKALKELILKGHKRARKSNNL